MASDGPSVDHRRLLRNSSQSQGIPAPRHSAAGEALWIMLHLAGVTG